MNARILYPIIFNWNYLQSKAKNSLPNITRGIYSYERNDRRANYLGAQPSGGWPNPGSKLVHQLVGLPLLIAQERQFFYP